MSLDATRWAWSQDLKATRKIVLLSLADKADEKDSCYPSLARIQEDTQLDIKTVKVVIRELENNGLLIINSGNGKSNRYQLVGVERWSKNGLAQKRAGPKTDGRVVQKRTNRVVQKRTTNLPVESTNESITPNGVVKSELSTRPKRKKDETPYQDIVDRYHEHCTDMPQVYKLDDTRKRYIKKLYETELPELGYWDNFFKHCASIDLLNGRLNNGRNWKANLEWITKPKNFLKIREEQYG